MTGGVNQVNTLVVKVTALSSAVPEPLKIEILVAISQIAAAVQDITEKSKNKDKIIADHVSTNRGLRSTIAQQKNLIKQRNAHITKLKASAAPTSTAPAPGVFSNRSRDPRLRPVQQAQPSGNVYPTSLELGHEFGCESNAAPGVFAPMAGAPTAPPAMQTPSPPSQPVNPSAGTWSMEGRQSGFGPVGAFIAALTEASAGTAAGSSFESTAVSVEATPSANTVGAASAQGTKRQSDDQHTAEPVKVQKLDGAKSYFEQLLDGCREKSIKAEQIKLESEEPSKSMMPSEPSSPKHIVQQRTTSPEQGPQTTVAPAEVEPLSEWQRRFHALFQNGPGSKAGRMDGA